MILNDIGNQIKCDRCGKIHDYENSDHNIRYGLWRMIFKRRQFPEPLKYDFCENCAIDITPIVHELRDIDEANRLIRKLRRKINVKQQRYQNNRAAQRSIS